MEADDVRNYNTTPVGRRYQYLAIGFCLAFGTAMILNTQMAGEGVWFWYTDAFHHGAKLYADLHLALQPLYILQTDLWTKLFGTNCVVMEIPSLLRIVVFGLALLLILKQSDWPDWQKAIVLAATFVISVQGTAYRFDDYHILADTFIFYSLLLLLLLAKAAAARSEFLLVAGLGVLSGLTITTRLNDGAALVASAGICILFLSRRRKAVLAGFFVLVAVLTVILVVRCTGDTLADYVSNSMVKAAGSKGGKGSIFAAPFHLFFNALHLLRTGRKWLVVFVVGLIGCGVLIDRRWKRLSAYIVVIQLAIAAVAFGLCSHLMRMELMGGVLVTELVFCSIVITYLLAPTVAVRFAAWKIGAGQRRWDPLEILILIPLAELASSSASTAGQPHEGFYPQTAMLLLLVPLIRPFRRTSAWANASFVTIVTLVGLAGVTTKAWNPYSWNDVRTNPMFVNRVWYEHPVYGPLYIDRDDLAFNKSICDRIQDESPTPGLLSLPYPYVNYFCAIPPWHGYVQTFFDTSTRPTIDRLMSELETAPPEWIVYQRQIRILSGAELNYNHGQPIAQRDLDTMIMQKIASGAWQVVQTRAYSPLLSKSDYFPGDGWYVIRTRH